MKPLKMLPWLARILWCVILAVCATTIHAAPAPPSDPLVGNWLYYKDHPVTFNADGTAYWKGGGHATWEFLRNPEVQRHYRLVWEQGKSIDTLVLNEDGQRAHVRNETGEHRQYDVRRAISSQGAAAAVAAPAVAAAVPPAVAGPPSPDDPVIGDWVWGTHGSATFQADGTVTSPGRHGVWEYQHNPGAARTYVVTWNKGNFVDTLTYSPGAASGHVRGKRGSEYEATRSAPGAPTVPPAPGKAAAPANPFGVPGQ